MIYRELTDPVSAKNQKLKKVPIPQWGPFPQMGTHVGAVPPQI